MDEYWCIDRYFTKPLHPIKKINELVRCIDKLNNSFKVMVNSNCEITDDRK